MTDSIERSAGDPLPSPDSAELPKQGQWYWLQTNDDSEEEPDPRKLCCVTHVGSNYVQLKSPEGWSFRVHLDDWERRTQPEPHAAARIEAQIALHRSAVERLLAEVRELTARLALDGSPALGQGGAVQALARVGSGREVDDYKQALTLAKEKTLPGLFKEIEQQSKAMSTWMKAHALPLHAQAEDLRSAIGHIEQRVFHVELYAGLCESVVQVKRGEPAALGERIRLLQRRHYMDEECLVGYRTGGMRFKDLRAFDRWLAKRENLQRILPFTRAIVAFRVRRSLTAWEGGNFSDFVQFLFESELDKLTFLYIRNGDQLWRLSTKLDFGAQLFPDLQRIRAPGSGRLWARDISGGDPHLITDEEYQALAEEEAARKREHDEAPASERWRYRGYSDLYRYEPYDPSSVYYDDIHAHVLRTMQKHNRIALVLQGLLDRSPVLHPHPPWQIWTDEGFGQAIELVYDDSRTLTTGDAPDFEAYRERLNASLRQGSRTVGQRGQWFQKLREELSRERGHDIGYTPSAPYGNPGPAQVATVEKWASRARRCTYRWLRERLTHDPWRPRGPVSATFTTAASGILNVDAYQPGDFQQFFADPRTRAEYLKWAPLLLTAEEFHAGNLKVDVVKERD